MVRLFIDGVEADTDQQTSIAISLAVASLTDLEKSRTGYTKTLHVPVTRRNRAIIGDVEEVNGIAFFNQAAHTARIETDGCTVMEGALYLNNVESVDGKNGYYGFYIIGASKLWAKQAAERMFRNLEVEFRETISGDLVRNSWTWDKPIRFLPVQRDKILAQNPNSNLFTPARVLTFQDYHPFLHVRSILEAVMREAGYTIESEFIRSPFFDSLHMSGNFPEHDVEKIKNRMDFIAGRFEDRQAVANQYGYVYANPYTTLNTVGNIVDTADPKESLNGQTIDGVFSTGGYFTQDEGRIAFIPPEEVTMGFEYRIFYTTEYYMASREELKCFNQVNLQEEEWKRFRVVNRNTDRRTQYKANKDFRIVVFGHTNGNSYQFRHDVVTNPAADLENLQPGQYTTTTVATFSTRSALVGTTTSNRLANPKLFVKTAGSSTYVLYDGDWALYDGYVEEYGTVEVDLTVRSAPERLLPSAPKYFNRIAFGGADPGMKITVSKLTRIRPVFSPYPAEGTVVEFADIAAHRIRQIDFVNALKHLFNLWFYTDHVGKTVYIEPRQQFCRNDVVVDWTDRIDHAKPVRVEELGAELARSLVFGYQDGDGAVARYNITNGGHYGSWTAEIQNLMAASSESAVTNPIFTPSIALQGAYPDAPDAWLIQAGDRDATSAEYHENLNFPAKIIHFSGMKPLPENQLWGWPGYERNYPKLDFFTGDQSKTLCFEDQGGCEGLHRFYDKNIRIYNHGKRVTAWLRLDPQDIEPFVVPNRMARDFRALFRLNINGEENLYRIEEIVDYLPGKNSTTQCVFIKEV